MGTSPGPEGRLHTHLGPDPQRPRARPAPPHRGRPAGRAVHTPARRSRPLGDPRRAAPPRGRCSAGAGREPAGGVPFKSSERRATAPPPSLPESSPHRAEPGSRCAPPLRFPQPARDRQPGTSPPQPLPVTGRPRGERRAGHRWLRGASTPRVGAPDRARLALWPRLPGRSRSRGTDAKSQESGAQPRPECGATPAGDRVSGARGPRSERTPGCHKRHLARGFRQRGHPVWRPGTRLNWLGECAPGRRGTVAVRAPLASADGGAPEAG